MIQSVDSSNLAIAIDKRARHKIPVLVEVNTSGEVTKFGLKPEASFTLFEEILNLKNLYLRGLMTIGPGLAVENPEASRRSFRILFHLREELKKKFSIELPILSMGMSSDFEIAIEEGGNMLRIGTLIFGPRLM